MMTTQTWHTEKLTRDNAIFIWVDFLEGFLPGLKTIDHTLLRQNVDAYCQLASIFKMPVIMLGEEGDFRGKFFPECTQNIESAKAIRVERHTPSAWDEPNFRSVLEQIGRKKVILGGISLDICTALLTTDLLHHNYECSVVVDVSGSDTFLNEQAAMLRLTQAGAVMTNWGSIASQIMGDWQTPEGAKISQLYQENSYWGGH
jgi:nicotinamidase-related amidase